MSSSDSSRALQLAGRIITARRDRRCLSGDDPENVVSTHLAYDVQSHVVAARADEGRAPSGWKLGYTSAVMREQMGIAEPNLGPLAAHMLLAPDGAIPETVMQPRVEPEIALVLGEDVPVDIAPSISAHDIRAYVSSAHAALEVVDSVWCGYRFTWAQNTADASSAAFVVIGPEVPLDGLSELPGVLERNGEWMGSGQGSAAMGDPFAALAWLAGRLAERGDGLRAGQVVITGGMTAAVPLEPGDVVSARIGSVRVATHRRPVTGDPTADSAILVP